jgi:hypothetical protein
VVQWTISPSITPSIGSPAIGGWFLADHQRWLSLSDGLVQCGPIVALLVQVRNSADGRIDGTCWPIGFFSAEGATGSSDGRRHCPILRFPASSSNESRTGARADPGGMKNADD